MDDEESERKSDKNKNKKSSPKKNKKKKKKYNKKNKSKLRECFQYLEIKENDKTWKYSLHFFNENYNNIYYNCLDTKCKGKGIYIINKEEKNHSGKEQKPEIDHFELYKDHDIPYDQHKYNIINTIIKDITTLSANNIKKIRRLLLFK